MLQLDSDNKVINIFDKIKDAMDQTSESRSTIKNSILKNRQTKRGYYWKFISEIDTNQLMFESKEIEDKYRLLIS